MFLYREGTVNFVPFLSVDLLLLDPYYSVSSASLINSASLILLGFGFLHVFVHFIFRTTPPSRPNKVGLKCLSVHTSVHPQKVSLISMTFGM